MDNLFGYNLTSVRSPVACSYNCCINGGKGGESVNSDGGGGSNYNSDLPPEIPSEVNISSGLILTSAVSTSTNNPLGTNGLGGGGSLGDTGTKDGGGGRCLSEPLLHDR